MRDLHLTLAAGEKNKKIYLDLKLQTFNFIDFVTYMYYWYISKGSGD
jgi:hypothetical protein